MHTVPLFSILYLLAAVQVVCSQCLNYTIGDGILHTRCVDHDHNQSFIYDESAQLVPTGNAADDQVFEQICHQYLRPHETMPKSKTSLSDLLSEYTKGISGIYANDHVTAWTRVNAAFSAVSRIASAIQNGQGRVNTAWVRSTVSHMVSAIQNGGKRPRAICLLYKMGGDTCTSWAFYNFQRASDQQIADISAVCRDQCEAIGLSCDTWPATENVQNYYCVRDRVRGC